MLVDCVSAQQGTLNTLTLRARNCRGGSSNTTGRWSCNEARVLELVGLEELDQALEGSST